MKKFIWVAISKKTLKPVAVKEYMEDLPFENNWLVEFSIDLPTKKRRVGM